MGGTTETTIELFSWWIAPGEAEALQAVIDLNRTNHPNERIFNAGAVSGMDARALLAQRLADNNPPTVPAERARPAHVPGCEPGSACAAGRFLRHAGPERRDAGRDPRETSPSTATSTRCR
jgi:hypothetical protein